MKVNEVECLIRMNQFIDFVRKQRFSSFLFLEITRYSFSLNARNSLFSDDLTKFLSRIHVEWLKIAGELCEIHCDKSPE